MRGQLVMSIERSGIAIIGMACKFPGAPDLETFRSNLEQGVDAITEAPPGRLDPAYFDPDSTANDRIYCRRGGFLGDSLLFDPTPFGIMPVTAEGSEPDQMLTLEMVEAALNDAGRNVTAHSKSENISVILGRGGYLGIRAARGSQHAIFANQLVKSVEALLPGLSAQQLASIKKDFTAQLGHYGPDTAIGLVPNITASLVANRFDFGGSAYTIDAACASSLIAIDHAVRELEMGRAHLVITGGVHLCDDLGFWNVFSRLGAISRSHQIRPFDRRADGLLIGEGIGILVLARQQDAERRGDRIYALIRGTGISSDGRGKSLMLPNTTGQLLALKRAWEAARLDPGGIGLLEAHGTGTPDGDRTELETIAKYFSARLTSQPALGTVKSMIGHTMPAAGAAGLIKAALALHHGFLPPTLHCEEPSQLVSKTGFRLCAESESWPTALPRLAGVNAFGFGGINAHVVLEAASLVSTRQISLSKGSTADMLLLESDSPAGLAHALKPGYESKIQGSFRLVVENPTAERRELAAKLINRGKRWNGRSGIWYSPGGFAQEGGRIAFIYPGVDGRFEPRIDQLAAYLNRKPPPYHEARDDLSTVPIGIIGLGRWLTEILEVLGIRPDSLAGHSVGEWTGMVTSGIVAAEESDRFVEQFVPALRLEMPGVVFGAVGCGLDRAEAIIRDLSDISVSHDNCPHPVILCGIESSMDIALGRLRSKGILCEKLSFRSGFHSPYLEPYLAPFLEQFHSFNHRPPTVPLWSATTLEPYPNEPAALNQLYVDHLLQRVRFRELTERLYDTGHRIFVQMGMGRLAGFVADTLADRPHMAASVLVEQRDGLQQLRRLAAELWCEGYPVRLDQIGLRTAHQVGGKAAGRGIRLELATAHPYLRPSSPAVREVATSIQQAPTTDRQALAKFGSDPVFRELSEVSNALVSMSNEVVEFWSQHQIFPQRSKISSLGLGARTLSRVEHYSVESIPEVIDHCFIQQPSGWENVADRFPVVPLTQSIDNLVHLAAELVPELIPIGLERIRANRWIEVAPPVEVDIKADFDGKDRVLIKIGDYLEGTVVLAEGYPPAPTPLPLKMGSGPQPCVTALQYYEDRWTFHGPAFRGLIGLGPMSENGVKGVIECLPARGALLDAAGQLAGYWCMAHTEVDRLALPYRIDRIRFFGPHPLPGTHLEATVHIHELTDIWQRADVEIHRNNRLWAKIEGLEDRRFQLDERYFRVWRFPKTHSVATIRPEGYCLVNESWRTSASRYFVARLYLNAEEMGEYRNKQVRTQRAWLMGRIAVKEAIRSLLWDRGHAEIFPTQVQVHNDTAGRPWVSGPWDLDLRVSLAHKEAIAVALIAIGGEVGVDLERIESRPPAFLNAAFHEGELDLLPEEKRDEWVTRLWVAKEAVSKARGVGLGGNPRGLVLTEIDGARLNVAGTWVETRREDDYIVGWTEHPSLWRPSVTLKNGE